MGAFAEQIGEITLPIFNPNTDLGDKIIGAPEAFFRKENNTPYYLAAAVFLAGMALYYFKRRKR